MATEQHTDLAFASGARITGLPDPSSAQHAATKAYVDALARRAPDYQLRCANIPVTNTHAEHALNFIAPEFGAAQDAFARLRSYAGDQWASVIWLDTGALNASSGFLTRQEGFRIEYTFGKYGTGSSTRFVGVCTSTGDSNADPAGAAPSARINCFGIGYDSGQTTLRLLHNDASGTCTATDLGSDFPVSSSARYKLTIWCAPGGNLQWLLERLDTVVTPAGGTVSSDIPGTQVLMHWHDLIDNPSASGETGIVIYRADAWLGAV